jgi:hypothetical protein
MFFDRMAAVVLYVEQIIEHVDAAGPPGKRPQMPPTRDPGRVVPGIYGQRGLETRQNRSSHIAEGAPTVGKL